MTDQIITLSEQDVEVIRSLIRAENQRYEDQDRPGASLSKAIQAGQSKTVYVAYPPQDTWIPSAQKSGGILTPGALKCCIFVVEFSEDPNDYETYELKPLDYGKDSDGNIINQQEWVFNIYEIEGDVNQYFQVYRSAKGRFFCEKPSGTNEGTTTTTPAPSTNTTPNPNDIPCYGSCIWIWDGTDLIWELDTDSCGGPTTTSTTTTLGPSTTSTTTSSTTTTPCPCPTTTSTTQGPNCDGTCILECIRDGGPFTWSWQSKDCNPTDCECSNEALAGTSCNGLSDDLDIGTCQAAPTTTSTTTTPAPCHCVPPEFCGETDGDCVRTYCIPEDTTDQTTPDCGQTTTTSEPGTTCDCNTTTTLPDQDTYCVDGCDWAAIPTGLGGWVWRQVSNGCAYNCPCPYPSTIPDPCAIITTGCIPTTQPPTTQPPVCDGTCIYIWVEAYSQWVHQGDSCPSIVSCFCRPPSLPGTVDCEVYISGCVNDSGGTTTTSNPCDDCYSTTSTTADPCTGTCIYECQLDGVPTWVKITDTCGGGCTCNDAPTSGCSTGGDIGSTDEVGCGGGTTTAPTTTTTPDPCDVSECMWRWTLDGTWQWVLERDNCPSECECGVPEYDGTDGSCEVAFTRCGSENRTTTTTVDPTQGACCYWTYEPFVQLVCSITSESTCDSYSGNWFEGQGCGMIDCRTTDAPTTQAPDIGACCLPNGLCSVMTSEQCSNLNGQFFVDTNCDGTLCGTTTTTTTLAPTTTTTPGPGACCYGLEASTLCIEVANEYECVNVYRGQYQGEGTDCDPNPCPGTTSTTSEPTTTTTAVPGCLGNECQLICQDGVIVPYPSDTCGFSCRCGSGGLEGVACDFEGFIWSLNCEEL